MLLLAGSLLLGALGTLPCLAFHSRPRLGLMETERTCEEWAFSKARVCSRPWVGPSGG